MLCASATCEVLLCPGPSQSSALLAAVLRAGGAGLVSHSGFVSHLLKCLVLSPTQGSGEDGKWVPGCTGPSAGLVHLRHDLFFF